jgi:hypothetical protein
MTCRSIEADLVDRARGVVPDAARGAALERHLRECRRCATRLDTERTMSAALRRLAEDTRVPPANADEAGPILAVFDAAWSRPRGRTWFRPATAAALTAVAATIAWMVATPSNPPSAGNVASPVSAATTDQARAEVKPVAADPIASTPIRPRGRVKPRPLAVPAAPAEFVVWPGAADLPTFESGQLMRMDLPAAVVASLGLKPSSASSVVQADVLVGQDGYARAVRLVP